MKSSNFDNKNVCVIFSTSGFSWVAQIKVEDVLPYLFKDFSYSVSYLSRNYTL